jgi:hypothetical protein
VLNRVSIALSSGVMPDDASSNQKPEPHNNCKQMKLPTLKKLFLSLGLIAGISLASHAADTVKVGVLHSLSGTMAISETSLKDVLLFAAPSSANVNDAPAASSQSPSAVHQFSAMDNAEATSG